MALRACFLRDTTGAEHVTLTMSFNPLSNLLECILYDSILWARKLKLKFNNLPELTQLVNRRAEIPGPHVGPLRLLKQ